MTLAEFRSHLQHPPRWIWGFLIAAVLGVAAFLRMAPHDEAIAALQSAKDSELKIQRQIRLSIGLEDQLKSLDQTLQSLDHRFIDPDKRGENLKFFFELAQAEDVKLEAVSPSPVVVKPPYRLVPFRLLVTGEFKKVVKFVRKVERGAYFFAPVDYQLQKGASGGESSESGPGSDSISLAMNFEFLAK